MMKISIWTLLAGATLLAAEASSFAFAPKPPVPAPSATPTAEPSPIPTITAVPTPMPSPAPTAAPVAVVVGDVTAAGTGCAAGSAVTEVSLDQRMIRVQLDQMNAAESQRKACSIAAPIRVQAGYQAVIKHVFVLGSYDLAAGVSAQASLEAFLAGQTGEKLTQSMGAADQDVFGLIQIDKANAAVTGCGQDAIVRVNSSLLVKAASEPVSARSSGARIAEIAIELETRPCVEQAR